MHKKELVFKEETIQVIREIKKIMLQEWIKHRFEVDQIVRAVRSNSMHSAKIGLDG